MLCVNCNCSTYQGLVAHVPAIQCHVALRPGGGTTCNKVLTEIQASLGSYTYAGSLAPHLKTRQELFRDHLRYCTPSYLDYGDIQQWRTHSGCLLLGCDIWLRGLTSDATSFPMVFNAKVKFQNERQYYTGAPDGGYGAGLAIQQDMIQGTPVMLQIYDGGSLALTASSGILSSQNLGHAQAQDILSGRSRRPQYVAYVVKCNTNTRTSLTALQQTCGFINPTSLNLWHALH